MSGSWTQVLLATAQDLGHACTMSKSRVTAVGAIPIAYQGLGPLSVPSAPTRSISFDEQGLRTALERRLHDPFFLFLSVLSTLALFLALCLAVPGTDLAWPIS